MLQRGGRADAAACRMEVGGCVAMRWSSMMCLCVCLSCARAECLAFLRPALFFVRFSFLASYRNLTLEARLLFQAKEAAQHVQHSQTNALLSRLSSHILLLPSPPHTNHTNHIPHHNHHSSLLLQSSLLPRAAQLLRALLQPLLRPDTSMQAAAPCRKEDADQEPVWLCGMWPAATPGCGSARRVRTSSSSSSSPPRAPHSAALDVHPSAVAPSECPSRRLSASTSASAITYTIT
jgi:hypothetical protein